jgi:transposase
MGQQPRTEPLFYYFRLEDQIPEEHLLRRLDRCIDFTFVRERLRDNYSAIGRPSIGPEVLLRLLLVGYLYGITSERRLMEEVRMHLAYRWFSRPGIRARDSRPLHFFQEPARPIPRCGDLPGSI